MRLVSAFSIVVMLGLVAGVALADPANVEPKPWGYGDGFYDGLSTYPESEPNDTCPGQATACGDVVNPAYLDAGNLDWYTFYVTAGTPITVGTDAVNAGDNTDTYIELYFECGGTILAQDDDSGPGWYSLISNYNAPSTGNYNLKVRGYGTGTYGPYKIFFNCNPPPPPPANDLCSGAIDIPRCTAGSIQGDNTAYHNDYDPGSGGCASGYAEAGKDAVYVMNLEAGDIVDMTYTQFSFDTAFYIVTNCANVPGSCVVGADDTFTGEPETIHYVVPSTGAYYLILDSYGTDTGGGWNLDYAIDCPAANEACCFPGGGCTMLPPAQCSAQGGTPQGPGSDCDPNPCNQNATLDSTWGQIKTSYR